MNDFAQPTVEESSAAFGHPPITEFSGVRVSGPRLPLILRVGAEGGSRSRAAIGGGIVAVVTDPAIPCPMVHLLCPTAIAPNLCDFTCLGGVEILLMYRRREHRKHATELYCALKAAQCARVVLMSARVTAP
jgi:hypothetical protein